MQDKEKEYFCEKQKCFFVIEFIFFYTYVKMEKRNNLWNRKKQKFRREKMKIR